MKDKLIDVYECSEATQFENYCDAMLKDGWIMKSCNIGFLNSEKYNFCGSFSSCFY